MDGDDVCWGTGKPLRGIPGAQQRRYTEKGLGINSNRSDALCLHTQKLYQIYSILRALQ